MDMRSLRRTLQWRKDTALVHERAAARCETQRLVLQQCPICASERFSLFVEVFRFRYCSCDECGHLFSQTPPSPQAIEKLYAGSSDERCGQAAVYLDEQLFVGRVQSIAKPKVEHVTGLLPQRGLWVDLGCATGEVLMAAKQHGWEVLGIESDPAESEFARRKGLNVIQEYIGSEGASEQIAQASVVSCLNLIEHIDQPVVWLQRIVSRMRPGAHIVIEVPRHPSLSALANQLFPELASRHIYPPDHLHIFTERSAELLLEKSDLHAVCVWNFGQDFFDFVSTAAARSELHDTSYYSQMLDLTPAMQQTLDDSGVSDVLLVVAKKVVLTPVVDPRTSP